MKLLTTGNTKTMKGEGRGYATYILHLAPSDLSGFQVCPMATDGCRCACLNTSGQGGMIKGNTADLSGAELVKGIADGTRTNTVQRARIRRTIQFFRARAAFMAKLAGEIDAAIRKADRDGMVPVFRLNGTSDLRWEVYPVTYRGETFPNIFAAFPEVQFYDYTKIPNRRVGHITNYHLTFSLADGNEDQACRAFANGLNVAVVYRSKPGPTVDTLFPDTPTVDGDKTDLRFLDPSGVIVALTAKGKAKTDRTGFVKDA